MFIVANEAALDTMQYALLKAVQTNIPAAGRDSLQHVFFWATDGQGKRVKINIIKGNEPDIWPHLEQPHMGETRAADEIVTPEEILDAIKGARD